jgi:hypothetical protein
MALVCSAHVDVDLWIVGFSWVPHSNENTQANIKSYHGPWSDGSLLKQKVLRGVTLHGWCGG